MKTERCIITPHTAHKQRTLTHSALYSHKAQRGRDDRSAFGSPEEAQRSKVVTTPGFLSAGAASICVLRGPPEGFFSGNPSELLHSAPQV